MGDNSPKTFEERVNDTLAAATKDDQGKWQLPEEAKADEALTFAAKAELRRRDTQASYTRAQQQLKQKEAEATMLLQGWEKDFVSTLPASKQADLAELKVTDPDAWREQLIALEQEQRNVFQQKASEVTARAAQETEAEYRARAMQEFQTANPDIIISDDVIENDIPPRVVRQLEKGEVDFATFLNNCKEYLTKGRVMTPGAAAPNTPNIGVVPGSSAPGGDATAHAAAKGYDDEIF